MIEGSITECRARLRALIRDRKHQESPQRFAAESFQAAEALFDVGKPEFAGNLRLADRL